MFPISRCQHPNSKALKVLSSLTNEQCIMSLVMTASPPPILWFLLIVTKLYPFWFNSQDFTQALSRSSFCSHVSDNTPMSIWFSWKWSRISLIFGLIDWTFPVVIVSFSGRIFSLYTFFNVWRESRWPPLLLKDWFHGNDCKQIPSATASYVLF